MNMTMHFLSGGRVRMRKTIYDPAASREETVELPVSCVLLRHAEGNVLFDTGCHPSVAENPEARWGALARLMTPVMPQGEHVVHGLKAIGVAACEARQRNDAIFDRDGDILGVQVGTKLQFFTNIAFYLAIGFHDLLHGAQEG